MWPDFIRRKCIHWITKDLFNALYPEEILRIEGSRMLYKGKELDRERMDEIIDNADKVSNSAIWKLLTDDAIYHANETMYKQSTDFGGMLFGKALLYAIDIMKERMKQLSALGRQIKK